MRTRILHRGLQKSRITCAVIVTSNTRTPRTDTSGRLAHKLLWRNGCSVIPLIFAPNDKACIQRALENAKRRADVVVTIGGTGVSATDVTVEVVEQMTSKRLEGFGEIFRALSYKKIGAAAMMSRAFAGVTCDKKIMVSLPGSTDAVRLAIEKILIPELGHLAGQVQK